MGRAWLPYQHGPSERDLRERGQPATAFVRAPCADRPDARGRGAARDRAGVRRCRHLTQTRCCSWRCHCAPSQSATEGNEGCPASSLPQHREGAVSAVRGRARRSRSDEEPLTCAPPSDGGPMTPFANVSETHSAVVFFAGDRAYKLKKPVRLDCLDFSTVEARAAACARLSALRGSDLTSRNPARSQATERVEPTSFPKNACDEGPAINRPTALWSIRPIECDGRCGRDEPSPCRGVTGQRPAHREIRIREKRVSPSRPAAFCRSGPRAAMSPSGQGRDGRRESSQCLRL
jgi:hypothetical protein